MTAYFIVRAKVEDAGKRPAFDHWYQTEHLPDAMRAFACERAWRGWSEIDPSVHYACYEFADATRARAVTRSDILDRLVAEFDRVWGGAVPRTRELIEVAQARG